MLNSNYLQIYCDGGSRGNPGQAACAFVVYDSNRKILYQEGYPLGIATNNEAEYFGVINACQWLIKNKQRFTNFEICFFLDSKLVVSQLNGLFRIKNSRLRELIFRIKILEREIDTKIIYNLIRREENVSADKLVNLTLDAGQKNT